MFFPQEMTELELIVPEKDLLPVTNVLARQGVFHQVDSSYLSSHAGSKVGNSWKEHASAYAALERQIMVTMQALAVEDGPPPADPATLIKIEAVHPLVEQIEQDVKNTNDQLTTSNKKLEQLAKQEIQAHKQEKKAETSKAAPEGAQGAQDAQGPQGAQGKDGFQKSDDLKEEELSEQDVNEIVDKIMQDLKKDEKPEAEAEAGQQAQGDQGQRKEVEDVVKQQIDGAKKAEPKGVDGVTGASKKG